MIYFAISVSLSIFVVQKPINGLGVGIDNIG